VTSARSKSAILEIISNDPVTVLVLGLDQGHKPIRQMDLDVDGSGPFEGRLPGRLRRSIA